MASHNSIVRLNPDGTVDSGFQAQVQFQEVARRPGAVGTLFLQQDGKVLIDQWPRQHDNGQPRNRPVRLKSDGTLDDFRSRDHVGDQIILTSDSKILS
jgi:hypothetical protein